MVYAARPELALRSKEVRNAVSYNHVSTTEYESKCFPGVKAILMKMTEKRRSEIRKKLAPFTARGREILKLQEELLAKGDRTDSDAVQIVALSDEFDEITHEKQNPAWLIWGVKQVEGLVVDGATLSISDWEQWPSALVDELVDAVKREAELNGMERKNFELLSTSGEPEQPAPSSSTVESASGADTGVDATVGSTLLKM